MSKRQSWNIILLFVIFIFGFSIATLVHPDSDYSENENRTLQKMPKISLESVMDGSFEKKYETYLEDQFVLRDSWIALKTSVERLLFKTESKDIYFADDDYLIEKHTDVFTEQLAQINSTALQQFVAKYEPQFGAEHMTVMIIPNAVDILADKLPKYSSPYDEEEYLAKVKAGIPESIWFDASSILKDHAEEEIFYRTDHHWKTLAAFYVYQKWAEAKGYQLVSFNDFDITTVTDTFEGTIQSKLGIDTMPDSIEIFVYKDNPLYTVTKNDASEFTYNLYDYMALDTKSQYDVFFGGNHAKVTIDTKAKTGRKLLVLKDSYAHCFVPFLLKEFDEIEMIDLRYYNQKLSELMEQNNYTDVLLLYNAAGLAEDTGISKATY